MARKRKGRIGGTDTAHRGAAVRPLLLALVAGGALAAASIALAAGGSLHFEGCVANNDRNGCEPLEHHRLDTTDAVAISPDGTSVYVASSASGAISSFHRSQDGSLTYLGCFADHRKHACQEPAHSSLAHPTAIALSPDGRSVYATSQNGRESALTVFDRKPDGRLRFRDCFANYGTYHCERAQHDSLADLSGVAVSPDGTSVYVIGEYDANAVTTFDRAQDGSLTYAGCIAGNYYGDERVRGCAKPDHPSLHEPEGIVVSPDGRSVYVGSVFGSAVTRFNRAGDGQLTYAGCFANSGRYGCRVPEHNSIGGVTALSVSPDGRSLYTVSWDHNAISRFDRGARGGLTYRGCYSSGGFEAARGCRTAPRGTLSWGSAVVVSPDGRTVYYGGGAIAVFDRRAGGAIGYRNCYADDGKHGCRSLPRLAVAADHLAISSDGTSLYTAGWESVAVFTRRLP